MRGSEDPGDVVWGVLGGVSALEWEGAEGTGCEGQVLAGCTACIVLGHALVGGAPLGCQASHVASACE